MSGTLWSRAILCEDAAGRAKEAIVLLDGDGCIAIKYPPGEGIRFRSAEDANDMRKAIGQAIVEQRKLGGEASS